MFVGHGGDVEVQKPRAVLGYRAPPLRLAALAPPVGRDGPYEIVEHGRDRRRCEGAILSLEWINAAGDEPLGRVGLLERSTLRKGPSPMSRTRRSAGAR